MVNLLEKLKIIFKNHDCTLNHSNKNYVNENISLDTFPHCQLDTSFKRLKKCAILIILFRHNNEFNILYTIRSSDLKSYPGEICYPGGKFDSKLDNTFEDTAFRETYEEIGLNRENLDLVCQLCPYISPIGHYLVPFVCLLKKSNSYSNQYEDTLDVVNSLKPNSKEVDSIFYLPFSYILDSNSSNERISAVKTSFELDESLSGYTNLFGNKIDFTGGYLSRVFISFNESLFEANKLPNSPILYGINATIVLFLVLTIEHESYFRLEIDENFVLDTGSIEYYSKVIRLASFFNV